MLFVVSKSKHLLRGSNKAQAASVIIPVVPQQNPMKFNPAYKKFRKVMFKHPTRFTTETNLNRASFKTSTFLSRLQYLWPKGTIKEWKGFLKYNCVCREGCRKQIVANQGRKAKISTIKCKYYFIQSTVQQGSSSMFFCTTTIQQLFKRQSPSNRMFYFSWHSR